MSGDVRGAADSDHVGRLVGQGALTESGRTRRHAEGIGGGRGLGGADGEGVGRVARQTALRPVLVAAHPRSQKVAVAVRNHIRPGRFRRHAGRGEWRAAEREKTGNANMVSTCKIGWLHSPSSRGFVVSRFRSSGSSGASVMCGEAQPSPVVVVVAVAAGDIAWLARTETGSSSGSSSRSDGEGD